MPGLGGRRSDPNQLHDNQIVRLADYVLTQYGRADTRVSKSDVSMARQGGPPSPLVRLAGIGVAAGAFVVLSLIGLLFFWGRGKRATG